MIVWLRLLLSIQKSCDGLVPMTDLLSGGAVTSSFFFPQQDGSAAVPLQKVVRCTRAFVGCVIFFFAVRCVSRMCVRVCLRARDVGPKKAAQKKTLMEEKREEEDPPKESLAARVHESVPPCHQICLVIFPHLFFCLTARLLLRRAVPRPHQQGNPFSRMRGAPHEAICVLSFFRKPFFF
nr:hypothetical protein [Pandoravirus aubagnensis]